MIGSSMKENSAVAVGVSSAGGTTITSHPATDTDRIILNIIKMILFILLIVVIVKIMFITHACG